jgi:hypothetical protein
LFAFPPLVLTLRCLARSPSGVQSDTGGHSGAGGAIMRGAPQTAG